MLIFVFFDTKKEDSKESSKIRWNLGLYAQSSISSKRHKT